MNVKNEKMKAEQLKHSISQAKTDRYICTASCLQCKPCGSGCTIVDNRISFIFGSEKKCVSHLLFDPTPTACMGGCGKTCQVSFRLVQEVELRTAPIESLNNN